MYNLEMFWHPALGLTLIRSNGGSHETYHYTEAGKKVSEAQALAYVDTLKNWSARPQFIRTDLRCWLCNYSFSADVHAHAHTCECPRCGGTLHLVNDDDDPDSYET